MTREQMNYIERNECCKYCKHLRGEIDEHVYCSIMDPDDCDVAIEDVCDSFKSIW